MRRLMESDRNSARNKEQGRGTCYTLHRNDYQQGLEFRKRYSKTRLVQSLIAKAVMRPSVRTAGRRHQPAI
jgi:hypothetical protein